MNRKETLENAIKVVCGERENQYGSPEDNFKVIANLWSIYLGKEVEAVDVSMMMALLKIARIKTGIGTDDSFIDLAGYAACGAEISTNKETVNLILDDGRIVETWNVRRNNEGEVK